jgi:hypothetical protein
MDHVDALLFALLAIGDMALIVFLRKRRNRRLRLDRMARCLAEFVQRDLQTPSRRRAVHHELVLRSEISTVRGETPQTTRYVEQNLVLFTAIGSEVPVPSK